MTSPGRRPARAMGLAVQGLAKWVGRPLTTRAEPQPRAADAIVVLGAPLTRRGALTALAEERVAVGVDLWRRGLGERVCISGAGPAGRVEAEVMSERARELGLPTSALLVDRRARNTIENARNVAALLPPGSSVWLVTQPFHLRRSTYLFRRYGLRPLAWLIEDSIQYQSPLLGLRWSAREYAAWLRLGWRLARGL